MEISESGGRDKSLLDKATLDERIDIHPVSSYAVQDIEDPFINVFDEADNLRILVQCRCREQQVTFHPAKDGVIVCREECYRKKGFGARTLWITDGGLEGLANFLIP